MKRLLLTATIAVSVAFGAVGAKANEPDPTDDGNIIVECVGAGGPTILGGPAPGEASYVASVPRHPLGPMSCGPKQHGRLF
jgi:hypothetical protein